MTNARCESDLAALNALEGPGFTYRARAFGAFIAFIAVTVSACGGQGAAGPQGLRPSDASTTDLGQFDAEPVDSKYVGAADSGNPVALDGGAWDAVAPEAGTWDVGTWDIGSDAGAAVSFSKHVFPIIQANCAGYCHPGSYSPMSLKLDVAHLNLVNAPSVGCTSGRMRVQPGRAGTRDSDLMAKLRGVDLCGGGQMPLGGRPLSPEQIDLIGAWISAGAPNN